MRRVRWLSAQWPISMRALASKMKTQPFTSESFDGFLIERVRDDLIEAHFIEKLAYQQTTVDPFGKEEVIDRVVYRDVGFTLFSDFPNIELRDPQRSTKEFVSKLLTLCNFSMTVTPVSVNLLEWIDSFHQRTNQKVLVDAIQLSGLELEVGISAKILLKGERDVREALQHLSGEKKFSLEKVQIKVLNGIQSIPIQMTSSGSVRIPPDHVDDLLPALRDSLPNPIQNIIV